MPRDRMQPVSLRLPPDLRDWLKAEAYRRSSPQVRVTESEIAREALEALRAKSERGRR